MDLNHHYSNHTDRHQFEHLDRNDVEGEPELHLCLKCRWEGRGAEAACPQCGSVLYSQQDVRQRGLVIVGLGAFFCVLAFALGALATKSRQRDPDFTYYGEPLENEAQMGAAILIIFGGFFLAGLAAIGAGLWQHHHGRPNMKLFWLFVNLVLLTFAVAGVLMSVIG